MSLLLPPLPYVLDMRPGGGGDAYGAAAQMIEATFGNQRACAQQLVRAAGDQFGSGWAWLVLDGERLPLR